LPVQANKVTPIDREQGSPRYNSKDKNITIVDALVRLSRLKCGQHIMAKPAKCLNNLEWEILIGIEPRQWSDRLLLTERLLNLFWVSIHVEPGIDEVSRAERWKVGEDLLIVPAKPAVSLDRPDWDAGSDYAGIAALHAGGFLDAGPCMDEFKGQMPKDVAFLVLAQMFQLGL
jgi:hypothetical protein